MFLILRKEIYLFFCDNFFFDIWLQFEKEIRIMFKFNSVCLYMFLKWVNVIKVIMKKYIF